VESKRHVLLKNFFEILVLVIIGFYLSNYVIDVTYAYEKSLNPDVIITIDGDGHITQDGDLFGDDLWYPGKVEEGIIEIINNNKIQSIKITNLGLDVKLNTISDGYDRDEVYNSFLNNMKLTIQKRMSVFNNIVDNKSFLQLLNKEDNDTYNGLKLENIDQISINTGKPVYLKYTLYMDKDSGNELQNLNGVMYFFINVTTGK
jgi:hypothetical protein